MLMPRTHPVAVSRLNANNCGAVSWWRECTGLFFVGSGTTTAVAKITCKFSNRKIVFFNGSFCDGFTDEVCRCGDRNVHSCSDHLRWTIVGESTLDFFQDRGRRLWSLKISLLTDKPFLRHFMVNAANILISGFSHSNRKCKR